MQRNCAPSSAVETTGSASVAASSPAMSAPSRCQRNKSGCAPEAETLKVADCPAETVCDAGCEVIAGALVPVKII